MGIFQEEKGEAIRPNFFALPTFVRDEEAKKKGLTDEERILAAGAETDFWRTLKIRVDQVIAEMDQINEQAMTQGASLEEIGRNTVVTNLTKGTLKRIFNIVEDARDAVTDGQ
jgi:hypothetical protein